ncbi:prephenate dehydrogenase [Thalassobacillus hwangdonensis]|uniref:Prephenate dehydrogenase n=1 Tax=Thalassobacillus hwangdonensis TaxID=546108 RepID=A0ABW3KY64_9BACI
MRQRVTIIGLGLIGGSLALSIRKHPDVHVLGYDKNNESVEQALKAGAIDEEAIDLEKAIKKSDILLLATPISKTIEYIQWLDGLSLNKTLIVSDVSSVKGNVIEAAESVRNPMVRFIGGHPMAGSHKHGFQAAKAHLFENAIYVLTPLEHVSEGEIEQLQQLLFPTNARFLLFDRKAHDEMTAVISHFPHLIASSLVQQARKWHSKHPHLEDLAAGGFRDITRIASSNPALWKDIFFQNDRLLQQMLDDWIREMQQVKEMLQSNEQEAVYDYLVEAKAFRDGLPVKKRGAIPAFYDIYVDIEDQPGSLHQVVAYFSDQQISIKNIEILEMREGITGVLRISFQTKAEQRKACRILSDNGYEVHIEE